ncbi:hypothetical protein K439DRAFT_1627581 [Ramaria rubella]|nr:hypothetical protein K439DRAFT_1627581 [Ramaria rubella]
MGHPFLDGNKRTAFWAANEYLKNSGTPTFTDAEPNAVNSTQAMQGIGEAHSRVAQSQMTVDELANIYSQALGL